MDRPLLLLLLGLLACALCASPASGGDDETEAWRARVEREVLRAEAKAGALDGAKTDTKAELEARVTALDARVGKLEKAAGKPARTVVIKTPNAVAP